jgi:hypothetical protein
MPENGAESHPSSARFVRCALDLKTLLLFTDSQHCQHFLFVSMDNVCLNTNKTHNSHPIWGGVLRRNWRIDKRRLKYQAAFVRF